MTKDEIIAKVKQLNFPVGSYVVFGSCPLAAAGIRKAGDIDILISKELFAKLAQYGWKEVVKSPNDKPLVKDNVEVMDNWDFSNYSPILEHLLATADIFDGIPFANLREVRKWKAASGRPKDLIDVQLIDDYFAKKAL